MSWTGRNISEVADILMGAVPSNFAAVRILQGPRKTYYCDTAVLYTFVHIAWVAAAAAVTTTSEMAHLLLNLFVAARIIIALSVCLFLF